MINYQSPKASAPFIMLDREIDDILSSDAYFLLIKLMKLAPKENNSNANLMEKTNLSRRRFELAKKELVENGYLDTQQLKGNRYAFYIGKASAKDCKHIKKLRNQRKQMKLKNVLEYTKN